MIETITLQPGVTFYACRDPRFKQGCLTFQLLRPMCREEAGLNALLPTVLLRGTRSCPDLRSITQRLDSLYGAAVSPLVRRVGDYQTTGLCCGFMDERFALPGDAVLEPMIGFLQELLLDSPLKDGAFLPEFVESEKKNLISTIESERNDKRLYAMSQLLRQMCREDSYGLSRLGEIQQVAAITPRELTEHYRRILKTSPIQIFYVGSAPAQQVARLLMPLLEQLERSVEPLPPQTALHAGAPADTSEQMDVTQGKLCMGFVSPATTRDPDFAAMQVFNGIFGGGMTSKLFLNVREKRSLCYFIGSSYYSAKGLVTVCAGIDFDQEQAVRQEVLAQLEACREGSITPQELAAAKEALLSALRATHDSPGAIESFYATAALSGLKMDVAAYMQAVQAVELADVVRAARNTQLHSSYFLKGESQ